MIKRGRVTASNKAFYKKPSDENGVGTIRPELVRRKLNRKSPLKTGRTIAEKREHLETANERAAARSKDKRRRAYRIIFTIMGFVLIVVILLGLYFTFRNAELELAVINSGDQSSRPTIEIIDEESTSIGGHLSARMVEFINQLSDGLREFGLVPVKAVIPATSIRQVNFYLDGYTGFIKTTIDRGAGVTAEDIKRLLSYLEEQGIIDFEYLDVRLDGKAYYK